MAWMGKDYFRWRIKSRLKHLGTLGIMVDAAPLIPALPTQLVLYIRGRHFGITANNVNNSNRTLVALTRI